MAIKRYKWEEYGFLPFAIVLFSYTVYRAAALSITHDEALSYFNYVKDSYAHIFSNHDLSGLSANNHILNSLLCKFFCGFLPLSELTLRLPALIGHILFLRYSWKVLPQTNSIPLKMAAYLLLNVQPYLLDFFSLSRGYGLSIGCMMAGLYYLKCLPDKDKKFFLNLPICFIFMGLSVLANLSLLVVFVAIMPIAAYIVFIRFRGIKNRKAVLKGIGVVLLTLLLVIIPLLLFAIQTGLKLKEAGALFYGGDTSFWRDTVVNLGRDLLYDISNSPVYANLFFGLLNGLLILILIATIVHGKSYSEQRAFLSLFAVLVICVSVNIIQHRLLQVLFPIGRTALFYYPLFVVVLIYAVHQLSSRFRWVSLIIPALALASMLVFACTANFNSVLDWKGNAYIREVMEMLKTGKNENGISEITIGGDWNDQPSFRFYKDMLNLETVNLLFDEKGLQYKEDIVFYPNSLAGNLPLKGYCKTRSLPESDVSMFVKQVAKIKTNNILMRKSLPFGDPLLRPYLSLAQVKGIELNPMTGSSVAKVYTSEWLKNDSEVSYQLNFGFYSYQRNNDCKVFMAMHTQKDSLYSFKVYPLAYENIKKDKYCQIKISFRMPPPLGAGSYLKLWLGNDGGVPVYIFNPEIIINQ